MRWQLYPPCALMALAATACETTINEVVVQCPPGVACTVVCDEDSEHCEVVSLDEDGRPVPNRPEAPEPEAHTPEPETQAPEPETQAPEPEAQAPEPEAPEPPEPDTPEPDAPRDPCMALCESITKTATPCVQDGLSALYPACEQVEACETLDEPADCGACLRALEMTGPACDAFAALCL